MSVAPSSSRSFLTLCRRAAVLALLLTGFWLFAARDTDGSSAVAAIPRNDVIVILTVPPYFPPVTTAALDIADDSVDVAIDATPASEPDIAPSIASSITSSIAARADDLLQLLKTNVTTASQMQTTLPKFATDYRSLRQLVTLIDLPRLQPSPTITGIASTYNPYRDGAAEGGAQTASGEHYDPHAWTAAIQIDLRSQFGGVRYGRLYQPAFALVASGDRQVIVKINDVGPLRPGRVIDLNERSMRYFDPFLRRGLLNDVAITLLPGEDWTPGPVGGARLISYASNL